VGKEVSSATIPHVGRITTDCQSDSHVSDMHLGPATSFYLYTIAVCLCGAPSLTRRQMCNLQLMLLGLARPVILGSEFCRTLDVFTSCRNKEVQLHAQALKTSLCQVRVKVALRSTVSWSVCFGVKHPYGSLPPGTCSYYLLSILRLLFHCVEHLPTTHGRTEERTLSAIPNRKKEGKLLGNSFIDIVILRRRRQVQILLKTRYETYLLCVFVCIPLYGC
jgi:hypothetical protein